jgi:hypothetical protein
MHTARLKVWHLGGRFVLEVAKEIADRVEADLRAHSISYSVGSAEDLTIILEIFGGVSETTEAVLDKYR